jgi:hypothetical protein
MFFEAIRDQNSSQLSPPPLLGCGLHSHNSVWLSELQPSHIHSRRKKRRVFFIAFKEDWEIKYLF